MGESNPSSERILFVTGRLAAPIVRDVVARVGAEVGFQPEVAVLNVSVAALLTTAIIARRLTVDSVIDRAILPGWCQGELEPLRRQFGIPFERGPKNIHDLPQFFGRQGRNPVDLSRFDIEILAEINHVPRLTEAEIFQIAEKYRADGADVIDLGCEPGVEWRDAGRVTRALVREGCRVSIDSFNRAEVTQAVEGGAELVLSCNASNVKWASQLGAELVVIPDDSRSLDSMATTIERLEAAGTRYRLDPILDPLAFGFADSLARYGATRARWPDSEIMMGVGNLTELTEVDSAGVNTLLAGVCQEWGIRSVLTTEVIPWCQSAIKELDLARRLMKCAVEQKVPPKHLTSELVMLRDPRVSRMSEADIERMRREIRDRNFRILLSDNKMHLLNAEGHWAGDDPYEILDRMLAETAGVDPQHAFYLGYELAKANTALTLGKRYTQDEALSWGFLTRTEHSAQERRKQNQGRRGRTPDAGTEPAPPEATCE